MADGMVVQTALMVIVIVITTINVALWAFRPGQYRTGPRAARWMGIMTMVWVIFLPAGGGVSLGFGADDLAAGQSGGWQGIVIGVIALASWPVVILALRKRHAMFRS
jgi:hypothetical protein